MVPQLWVSVDEPMQLLLPPQVAVPWQVRVRVWLPFEQTLHALQELQLLLVGTFTPPPHAPLHWIVSPVVQLLPSLQAVPVLATHPPHWVLLVQVPVQEVDVLATLEQVVPEH